MSFTTTNPWVRYAGNDSTTEFAFNHKIHAQGDVVVLLTVDATNVTTTQTITTHYTVADVAEDAHDNTTPTITMLTPPATGETLTIYRQVDLIMDTSFLTTTFWQALPAEKQNELSMMSQQWLYLLVSRTFIGSLASDPITTTAEEILVAIGIIPISSLPAKTTPVDADVVRLGDSEDGDADKKLSLTNHWLNYLKPLVAALYSLVTSQAGAPSSTPAKVGDLNIDTTDDLAYIATDTVSSADWDRLLTVLDIASTTAKGIQENAIASEIDNDDASFTITPEQLALSKYAGVLKETIPIKLINTAGNPLVTGAKKVYRKMPYSGNITGWWLEFPSGVSDTITIDIWKAAWNAVTVPTVANTIIGGGGTKPNISGPARGAKFINLTAWTVAFSKDDVFEINIDAVGGTAIECILHLDVEITGV